MARPQVIQRFYAVLNELVNLEKSRIHRDHLGAAALTEAKNYFADLQSKISVAESVAEQVADATLDQFTEQMQEFLETAKRISALTDGDFVQQREQSLRALQMPLMNITATVWPAFIASAVEKSGILTSTRTQIEEIRKTAAVELDEFKREAEKLISAQKVELEKINSRVQKTAQGVSVAQAQEQFESAKNILWGKAKAWGAASGASFLGFVGFGVYLMHHPPTSLLGAQLQQTAKVMKEIPGPEIRVPVSLVVAQTTYLTAIRLTLLTALGALTTFCLRMMRSAIHMAEYNDHRRRIANSITSFVEAAANPDQRDAILLRLVDSVAQFGESGLLANEKDSVSAPTIAFEAITKNLGAAK